MKFLSGKNKKRGSVPGKRGSNFTGAAGIIVLAAIFFAAAYFQIRSLVVLLVFLLFICLFAFLWSAFSFSRLKIKFKKRQAEAFPGEKFLIRADVENRKFLPVSWLELFLPDEVKAVLKAENEEELCRLTWIMPYQNAMWQLEVLAVKRGTAELKSLVALSGDGLGLSERKKELEISGAPVFIIYPKIVKVTAERFIRKLKEFEHCTYGRYEDETLIRNTRDYAFGDNARKINWRQTAHTGRFMVNVNERQELRRLVFVLDMESFVWTETIKKEAETVHVRRVYEEEFEEAASLTASLALELLKEGICCTLKLADQRVTARHGQESDILRALAFADPLKEKAGQWDPYAEAFGYNEGPVFLFTRRISKQITDRLELWRDLAVSVVALSGEAEQRDDVIFAKEVYR